MKRVFRIVRNFLAICGLLFIYLLALGYTQYMDRLDAGDAACTLTRCA